MKYTDKSNYSLDEHVHNLFPLQGKEHNDKYKIRELQTEEKKRLNVRWKNYQREQKGKTDGKVSDVMRSTNLKKHNWA